MVTIPKIVRVELGRYDDRLVFELDPHFFASDPQTVLVLLGGKTIHVDLRDLARAVDELQSLAHP